MDERKEQPKEIGDIFEGTWEFVITDPEGKKKSDEITIKKKSDEINIEDKSWKYYTAGVYVYDFKAEFVNENILIHKIDITNKDNQTLERIDYRSQNDQILSGTDGTHRIDYIKQHIVYFKVL